MSNNVCITKEKYEELFEMLKDSGEYPSDASIRECIIDMIRNPQYYPGYF